MTKATDIGDQLQRSREAMGLAPEQAAERLHVDVSIIDALETGKFKALGAPVFARGHLRRYAELLGESESAMQEQYASLQEASEPPDLTNVPHLPAQPQRSGKVRWQMIVLTAVLVLTAIVWWAMRVKAS